MKSRLTFVVLAALSAGVTGLAGGEITGTITLKGTPPPEKPLPLDPFCSQANPAKPTTRFYMVGDKSGLADVTVYLKGITGKSSGATAAPAVLDQKGCEYLPYIAGAQTNQKIVVKNSDPLMHNVHPTPAVPGNKEENKVQIAGGPELTFVFANAEPFLRFKCDVHPWMFSYVTIFDHPYFAVTDKDGKFKIANVPDGKYTLEINHRKAGTATQEVEVKGGAVTVAMTMDAK